MPLPKDGVVWPPNHMTPMYAKMAEWSAWYSGDPERIMDVYGARGPASRSGAPWWRFWSRARAAREGQQRSLLHVPVASDLAGLSAALLFGEAPRVRVRPAHTEIPAQKPKVVDPFDPTLRMPQEPEEPTPQDTPHAKSEERLLQVLERSGFYSTVVEAAESAAAIGGVFIYPTWDKDIADTPFLAFAQSDQAVPYFRHGRLVNVTFIRTVEVGEDEIWRHVELHEVEESNGKRVAVVLNGLYRGSANTLGVASDLGIQTQTKDLPRRVELPFDTLDVEYVPNIRPNRLWRASGLGVADVQGSESLMDALDEVYASWMRDVRLAKARIIVPRDYLKMTGKNPNESPAFDADQEVYVPMEMDPGLAQDARAMMAHQFNIRYREHGETARDLVSRIVSNAGYTPITQGLGDASTAGSGAALRVSEHRTLLTLKRKSAHWRRALGSTLEKMMLIDQKEFGGDLPVIERPTVVMADSIIDSPTELAQTALAMKTAEASSIETRVRIINPDWNESEIAAEVARIKDESAPPPAMLPPEGFGDDESDPASGAAKKPITDQSRTRPGTPRPPSAQPRGGGTP